MSLPALFKLFLLLGPWTPTTPKKLHVRCRRKCVNITTNAQKSCVNFCRSVVRSDVTGQTTLCEMKFDETSQYYNLTTWCKVLDIKTLL